LELAFEMNDEEFLATMQIARTRNIGPKTFLRMIQKWGKPSSAYRKITETYNYNSKSDLLPKKEDIEAEIEKTSEYGGNLICIFDEKYPEYLKEIDDPPIIFSYIGNIELLKQNCVGIVGSRNCSANSISFSYKISKELAEQGYTVISGLARGIDTAAHRGALSAEGKNDFLPTVAVLGGGIDHIYPKENEELFHEIKDVGLIISENPIGKAPKSENFPRRNRIISGLSKGVLVVEAALKSGSLITARFASEQGREVMAVPGFPLDKRSEGTNKLIKNGAGLVTSTADIISCIDENSLFANSVIKNSLKEGNQFDFIEKTASNDTEAQDISIPENILQYVDNSPVDINRLSNISGVPIAKLNSLILEHELTGEIIRHPGNKISKAA
jgi:DNA processing protein